MSSRETDMPQDPFRNIRLQERCEVSPALSLSCFLTPAPLVCLPESALLSFSFPYLPCLRSLAPPSPRPPHSVWSLWVSTPLSPSPAVCVSVCLGLCLPPSQSSSFSLPTSHSMPIPSVFLVSARSLSLSDLGLRSLPRSVSNSPKTGAGALVPVTSQRL